MVPSRTTVLLQEAVALHRRGAVLEAATRYAEVLRTEPSNADAHYYLGMMSCQDGRFAEGAEFARKSLAGNPRHARAHVLLGRTLSALGRHEEALASFERAIALAPDLAQAHASRADVLSDLGRNAEAVDSYDRALDLAPDAAEDWFNRGAALLAVGRHDDAIASFDRAIAVKPAFALAHLTRAKVLSKIGHHTEAVESYDRALGLAPDAVDGWFNRGRALLALGRRDEAVASFDRAIACKPDLAEAWLGRGHVFYELKRHDDALAAYDRALALSPDLAEAWLGRGNVLYELNHYDDASTACDRALAFNPDLAEAWLGRGNVFHKLKRHDDALVAYDRALALNPNLAEAWAGRGNVLYDVKQHNDASTAYDTAVASKPDLANAWLGRGNVFYELKRYNDAFAAYDKALSLNPDLAEALLGRGNGFAELKRHDDALAAYDRALALKPDLAEAWLGRGNISVELKQYANGLAAFDRSLALNPDSENAAGFRLNAKLQMCDWSDLEAETAWLLSAVRGGKAASVPFTLFAIPSSPADQLQCASRHVQARPALPPIWRGEVYSHDRIRVAYLSADFHEHATAYLAAGLFEDHDRSRFEVTGLSFGPDDGSETRHRIKRGFERFVDVQDQDDQDVAKLIRRLEIDIAVDLKGHTQNARLGILARRPAPIQVNYLGYPGTMGADYIDYILADPTIVPEEHFDFYMENVVWLPDSYQVNDHRRAIARHVPSRAECGLPDAAFVFCCFNNAYKITPKMFDIWMRLLSATENSVLWLFEGNPTASANLRREAAARGISPERLIFAPKMPAADHLARQRQANLFLDTIPCNAHTTASDALWAELPVVTCLGSTFAGRVAASLLKAADLAELITMSLEDYEALALRLAHDPSLLAAVKAKLARNRTSCALFDTQRFTRQIEAVYATMWQSYVTGRAPASFSV